VAHPAIQDFSALSHKQHGFGKITTVVKKKMFGFHRNFYLKHFSFSEELSKM